MIKTKNFIAFVLIVYFILRTYGIVQVLPSLWLFPLIIISFFSFKLIIKNKKSLSFLINESKWIILSFFIISIYLIFQYGNFKLNVTFFYLISSIPFYIIGFYSGIDFKNNLIYIVSSVYFIFISLYLFPKILFVLSQNSFDSRLFISLFVDNKDDNDIIFFLPFVAFITIYSGYLLLKSKKSYLRFFSIVFIILNISALFLAGKAGAFAVILFTIIFYFYKRNTSSIIKYRNTIASVSIVVLFLIGVNNGLFGELGTLKSKSEGIVMLLDSGLLLNDEILNIITSDRWTAGIHSFQQFINKPVFGNGVYLDDVLLGAGGSETLYTAAGGHSFVLDTLAYYGVFGIPIIFILINFLKISNSYNKILVSNSLYNKEALVFSSLMGSVIVINILNTGFLFSYFDNFLFLLSGYYLGKYYRLLNPIDNLK